MTANHKPDELYCSFCGKSQHEVQQLIAGPASFICDECVDLCFKIVEERRNSPDPAVKPARAANQFHYVDCVDCDRDACPRGQLSEHYMVQDAVWAAAGMTPDGGRLCIKHLERRLGRQLERTDFTYAPISVRLRDCLGYL